MKTLIECMELREQLMEKFYQAHPSHRENIMVKMVGVCQIIYNHRMRTTAGRAFYREQKIEMNVGLLTKNPHHFDDTFAHELAHLVSYAAYKEKGHGQSWRYIMRVFGYEPKRCHNLDTSDVDRVHPIIARAKCRCMEHKITRILYRRMGQGRIYTCKKCRGVLQIIKQGGSHESHESQFVV